MADSNYIEVPIVTQVSLDENHNIIVNKEILRIPRLPDDNSNPDEPYIVEDK